MDEPDKEEHVDPGVGGQLEAFFGHISEDGSDQNVPPENFDESEFYEKVLAPKLLEVQAMCQEHRIPFLATVIFSREPDPDHADSYRENFIMVNTDPTDLRTGILQRGIFAVVMDTNLWTIGPSALMTANANLSDLLGGILNGQQGS